MEILNDLLKNAEDKFKKSNAAKKLGFVMTYQEFQAIEFLRVNFHILSEEFGQVKAQNKELHQFKLNYHEHKRKWDLKVSANAGDVTDQLMDLTKANDDYQVKLDKMEAELNRYKKENLVFRNLSQMEKLNFDAELISQMIEKSD